MKKVMLVLFSFAGVDDVIDRTFELLEKGGELEVVAFVEEELPESLSDLISDIGFLGDKVTKDVKSTIVEEYKDRAKRNLATIDDRAEGKDYAVDMEVYPKEKLDQIRERLRSGGIDQVVVNYTDDEFISEEVLVYPLDKILAEIDFPYEVYYDGELKMDHTRKE